MIVSTFACRTGVGALLVIAAIAKLRDPSGFFVAVERLTQLRGGLARFVGASVLLLELLLGGCMFAGGPLARYAGVVAAILMLAFAAALASSIKNGQLGEPCGCFGPKSRVSWAHVVRNLSAATFSLASVPTTAAYLLFATAMVFMFLSFAPWLSQPAKAISRT